MSLFLKDIAKTNYLDNIEDYKVIQKVVLCNNLLIAIHKVV